MLKRVQQLGGYADQSKFTLERPERGGLPIKRNVVLLPGLDGTAALFEPFVAEAPSWAVPIPVALPNAQLGSYDAIADGLAHHFADLSKFMLVAESFSGPLAIKIATRYAERCTALILCASFVTSPVPVWAHRFPWAALFSIRLPTWAIRRYLLEPGSSSALISAVKHAIGSTSPLVLRSRIQLLANLDSSTDLAKLQTPVAYLRATRDRLVSPSTVKVVLDNREDIAVAEIDGPHLLLQTRPARCWAAIERLVDLGAL